MAAERTSMNALLRGMLKHDASDLHLKVGMPPIMRVRGDPRPLTLPPLSEEDVVALLREALKPEDVERYLKTGNHDTACSIEKPEPARFRVNIFRQRGLTSVAIRWVKCTIPTFEKLNLPKVMERIADEEQGLVIFAGVTGSGKSTSLAAVIDYINTRKRTHIITLEDPIEYVHRDKLSFVNQREIGVDVGSFIEALRYVVREDPDVILVGEMRDEETFFAALTAAETGHLVFGTVHASGAGSTISRILNLFTEDRQPQIREGLVFHLRAVVVQTLLPSCREDVGRVPACEVMIGTPTIQKLIREGREGRIGDAVRAAQDEGMQDFNQSIVGLINAGLISRETGLEYSPNPEALEMNLKGVFLSEDRRILG